MAKSKQILEKVEELLKKDSRGLTIQDLADKTNVSRITVSVALAKLEGAGKVEIRKVSAAKIYYWKGGK